MKREWTVHFHSDFESDVRAQVRWLVAHRQRPWLEKLEQGLDEAVELLLEFPGAGEVVGKEPNVRLRKLVFRKVPYLAWYAVDELRGEVWFLRLFHARQKRPSPNLERWLKS